MATFGEIIYSILDILKERSDDSFYTEEHVLFLAKKMRALLLERKYKSTRNSSFQSTADSNKQQICVDVEPAQMLSNGCAGGSWLRSTQKIPDALSVSDTTISAGNDLLSTVLTFIPAERMPYVGYNKWLRGFIYAAKSEDGYLYLKGNNPSFMLLDKVRINGTWSDPEAAASMSEEACAHNGICDIMSTEFPLEDALIPSCIELVVQELAAPRYAPVDSRNNAKDDLGDAGLAQTRTPGSAERIARKNSEMDRDNASNNETTS